MAMIYFGTMNGLEFIKSKQQSWARRVGFELVGGTIPNRGEKNYLPNLTDNLFEPLSKESFASYKSGDGNETRDSKTRLAKMKALHSSSAIVVNLFQYWQGKKDISPILNTCRLCSRNSGMGVMIERLGSVSEREIPIVLSPLKYEIKFEEQYKISEDKSLFPHSPNIDVVVDTPFSDLAIEAKFTEPYSSRKHGGLKEKYIDDISFWDGLPNLYELAKEISPNDNRFQYLDAAQLIKHILGLKRSCKKKYFRLFYLWYDVIGQDGAEHRKEIEQFAEIAKKDDVRFNHITYQEVIVDLAKEFYNGNESYCDYLTNRYL